MISPQEKLQLMRQAEINPGLAMLTMLDHLSKMAELLVEKKLAVVEAGLPEKVLLKHVEKLRGEPGKDAPIIDEKALLRDLIASIGPKVLAAAIASIDKPKDGHTPTEEELVAIIQPLIPPPVDGHTPTKQELLSIIQPLIPVLEDMRPTEDELLALIQPLISQQDTEEDKLILKKISQLENEISILKKTPRSRKGGKYMHGGGDTILAGTNITFTLNSDGSKTINSPGGGGGFSLLDSTETPDGATTVFTFSTAADEPTYLVVDKLVVKAVNKNGTINWTWNAGTLQATLLIPPPKEDIFAWATSTTPVVASRLLAEDGGGLLTEDGDSLITE